MHSTFRAWTVRLRTDRLTTLYFDCESRPLGWIGADYVHQEITVIAWQVDGQSEVRALSKDDRTRVRMLRDFRQVYDQAGMVVGHYIRAFDLPLVNAMLGELGEAPLGPKLAHDTKLDLVRMHGLSKSQKNLSELFEIPDEKLDMSAADWRRANRLTPDGIAKACERAVMDVAQNVALHTELKRRQLLGPPKVWRPS